MRVFISGAGGFVGRWLSAELESAGHEVVALPRGVDVRDGPALSSSLEAAAPEAVAHLAAISFALDAAADPGAAFDTAVTGTINVIEALRRRPQAPALLVTGSSEVYGAPLPAELPLTESSPLRPATPYALSKAAQEAVVLAYAARHGLPTVVTRSFNHTGPGQRAEFVVPALARRIHAFANGEAPDVPAGNLDVRRDITDVRDVVRAYRLLLEGAVAGKLGTGGTVVNVSSGASVSIREIAQSLCRLAGVAPAFRADPRLVRPSDPPEIRGDNSLLRRLTGWSPSWTLDQTLASMWAEMSEPQPGAIRG